MHPNLFPLMSLVFAAVPLGGLVFFGWLGLRFVRARERDVAGHLEAASAEELTRLQDTVVNLQSEVHALRERQEFVERLLERPRSQ
jgi:hypothetical protein